MLLRSKPILLIENNAIDNHVQHALEAMNVKSPLVHLNNSQEALAYLEGQDTPKPWLILLRLHTQNPNGLDFLKALKSDTQLKIIPVVIIADSQEEQKISRGFELGIAGYIVKPQNSSKIDNTIKTIMDYWNLSELPPSRG